MVRNISFQNRQWSIMSKNTVSGAMLFGCITLPENQTLGKTLNFSLPNFPHLQNVCVTRLNIQDRCEDGMD